eukprot:747415-Hanusia_phi.AAC.8
MDSRKLFQKSFQFLQEPVPCSPNGIVAGIPICKQPILKIVDIGGNNVISTSSYVHANLVDSVGKDASSALSGTLMVEYVNGQAAFNDLSVTSVGVFSLHFFTTNGAGFELSSRGSANALQIVVQPDFASPGYPFSQQPEIQVVDVGYNLVTNWTDYITAELLVGGQTSLLMVVSYRAVRVYR